MFEHGLLWATILMAFTLTKAALAATLVIYPSYKTYKALESRSLSAAQGMLLYWCMTAFVNAGKEVVDQVLGTYSNVFLWKLTVLVLRAAPLIIGPERMYAHIIKPLFDAHEEQVDAVVDKAHALKTMAQEAVPAAKEGDIDAVKAKAGEIATEIKEDGAEIVEQLREQAAEVAAVLEQKVEAIGLTWDRRGTMGVLEQAMSAVEQLRDYGVDLASAGWEQHGPMIKSKTAVARSKGVELYNTHAPVVRQKVVDFHNKTVLPKLQPVINKANQTYAQMKPVATAQIDKAQALWQQHGGPVRNFYTNRALPFYQNRALPFYQEQAKPFFLHSFLPAVYETLLALKDRLVDLLSPPSEEIKTQRADNKRRRREANEARQTWKRRGDKVSKKWSASFSELDADAPAAASSEATASSAIDSAATLTNRRTKESRDSSLDKPIDPEDSILDPSAPVFEPAAPEEPAAPGAAAVWAVSKPAGIEHEAGLPLKSELLASNEASKGLDTDKLGDKSHLSISGGGLKDDAPFGNEPRSGRMAEPIQ